MARYNATIRPGLTFDDVLLVPHRSRTKSRALIDTRAQLTPRITLAIPIVSANAPFCTAADMAIAMARLGGIGFIHRMNAPDQQAQHVRATKAAETHGDEPLLDGGPSVDSRGRLLVGAAVGVKGDFFHRARLLLDAGADVLVVDVAHAHADHVLDAVERLTREFHETELVVGNIATGAAANDLIGAGAAAVKVGIGPGSVCTTRVVTGCGVPQLTAILDCARATKKHRIPLIADGGIRSSGDITKALAAGASTVVLGGMLAGTDESCARSVVKDGRALKTTTGFSTLGMSLTLKRCAGDTITDDELMTYTPEGTEATFEATGPVHHTILRCVGGLRSGMSYSGARTIPELWKVAEFVGMSAAGHAESRPHILERGVPQVEVDVRANG